MNIQNSYNRILSFVLVTIAFAAPNAHANIKHHFSKNQLLSIPPGYAKVADLKPTFYWVTMEQQSGEPRDQAVHGLSGQTIAQVSSHFLRNLNLEGTGKLLDGRLLNFSRFVDLPNGTREIQYVVCPADAPYGYGVDGRKLEAYRSVAVDTRLIPLDSNIFIPAAVGSVLPDGSIHDGYFKAVDIGNAIVDYRIDVFTGFGDNSSVFSRNGFQNMRATPVYVKTVTSM